jgi:hypothetical protein
MLKKQVLLFVFFLLILYKDNIDYSVGVFDMCERITESSAPELKECHSEWPGDKKKFGHSSSSCQLPSCANA